MRQLLKLTAVSALALAASTASAGVRQGPYVGLGIGYANLNPNGKATTDANAGGGAAEQKLNKKASGAQLDIRAGYEWTTFGNSGVLGLEVFGGVFNSTESKQDHVVVPNQDTRTDKLKLRYTVGISVNPGIEVSDAWTLYLKLAAVYGNFKVTAQADEGAAGYSSLSQNLGLWGFEPGLRVKWAVNDAWAITLDGSYAMYQSKKSKNFAEVAGQSYTINIKPRVWNASLGVSYKF